jgi:hypothetical protein
LFIELVRTGLQTRLSKKIEFFERPDGLSSHPNNCTFDHHFAYRITPTRTYRLISQDIATKQIVDTTWPEDIPACINDIIWAEQVVLLVID